MLIALMNIYKVVLTVYVLVSMIYMMLMDTLYRCIYAYTCPIESTLYICKRRGYLFPDVPL